MLRDKDKALAESCTAMAKASLEARSWFADNGKLVGARQQGLQRSFRKHAVEAEKLAAAATRPMSVAAFGASQAGKSFLIGALIAPHGAGAQVVFGSDAEARQLDFLDEVNPQGGNETTGLVTRFSVAPQPTPAGHTVALRLLSEIDIVKILANAFLFDLGAEGDWSASEDDLMALRSDLESAGAERQVDAVRLEDIFELRDYLEQSLARHPLAGAQGERYWAFAEDLLPRLAPAERAKALAPLWGGLPEFTELYSRLKAALDQLGHPEWAYVPLEALTDRSGGILHVRTLYGLDLPDQSDGPVPVATDAGVHASLAKPVVTALTAELRVTLTQKPWPFFEHTDLLDFPGARSRLDSTPDKWLRNPEENPEGRAQCFLRGKVAVLFDNYVADLDLNSMLLCVGPENQEVRKLPELIEGWIARTHGRRPEDREGRRTSLFFCMTKADRLFDLATGASDSESTRNRLANNIGFYPGWTEAWTPGRPFDNCYLIRNPNVRRDDLFLYDANDAAGESETVPPETGVRDDKAEWLARFRETFVAEELVRRHLGKAEEKWEAMLRLNDGGISYLAESLEPLCDPDLKYEQIQPRAEELRRQILAELTHFHEAGDIQSRVEERMAQATDVVRALMSAPETIGCFLRELMVDEDRLGQAYLDSMRQVQRSGETSKPRPAASSSITIELPPGMEPAEPSAPETPTNGVSVFGDAALQVWLDDLERRASDDDLAKAFNLTSEQFLQVINELAVAANRLDVPAAIETQLHAVPRFGSPDEVVHRVAMAAALTLNGLVSKLGTDLEPEEEADSAPKITFQRPAEIVPGGLPNLPDDPAEMARVRGRTISTWLGALRDLARRNASWGQGGFVDPEQNRRLGDLISQVRG